jgi:CubicO group peptidase (beta-lactamase class C family)
VERHSRREFIAKMSGVTTSVAVGASTLQAHAPGTELDKFIEAEMQAQKIPGLAACLVKSGKIVWSKGYGWSDIKRRVPMDPQSTIQNIGSIAKTVTATAAMQLWEEGKFDLDDDINQYLPFPVRNTSHPDRLVSFRSLLTHRSSIADSSAYSSSYGCGDPGIDLATWIKAYFTVGGRYYVKEKNFHPWKPGEKHQYSNVGFGLLGYLVERLSGESFDVFTKKRIFDPLGMKASGWMLSGIPRESHAVPYVPVTDGQIDEVVENCRKSGMLGGNVERDASKSDYQPLCLYGFPNYPDGLLRTSVNQLARFLIAYINQGIHDGVRILEADTIRLMLTRQHATPVHQGLCWVTSPREGRPYWLHNGSDPGIRTKMAFRPSDGAGVIVFTNRSGVELHKFSDRLFKEADRI